MGAAESQNKDRQIFEAIAQKISKITGVQLGEKQYSLVLSRLSKHFRNMGGMSPQEYWEYLKNNEEEEVPVLISLLTTHHTFFFREQVHFDYLEKVLPDIVAAAKAKGKKTIKIWCAACSKGQEGYTLGMFLDYHLKQLRTDMDYQILFSDVDTASVKWAENGVYLNEELNRVPITYRSNHWVRGKGEVSDFSKIRNTVKSKCEFRPINLMELAKEKFHQKFDLVFCRNVFIYFTVKEIESISRELLKNMEDHALFFIGVSESLMGATLSVDHLGKSIYKKSKEEHLIEANAPKEAKLTANAKKRETSKPREHLEVVKASTDNVKPSESKIHNVLTLQSSLKLSAELRTLIGRFPEFKSVGFDLVKDANEAIKKINDKKVDILILEIGCLPFLQKILTETSAKVLIASGPGADSTQINHALDLGSQDYVMIEGRHFKETEIKSLHDKLLKIGNSVVSKSIAKHLSLDASKFTDSIIGIGASTGGTEAITSLLTKLPAIMPPIVIVQHIPEVYSKQFADRLDGLCQLEVREAKDGDELKPGLALVAPGNFQMKVVYRGGKYKVKVYDGDKVSGHKPSVDVLFNSLAEVDVKKLYGVILTGMGSDGAQGLLKMKQAGAKTVSQNEESCVVYGMPKVAHELGASDKELDLGLIPDHLVKLVSKK